jgi:hypothetical protein
VSGSRTAAHQTPHQSRCAHLAQRRSFSKTVAEKSHVGARDTRCRRKSLTTSSTQIKTAWHHHVYLSSVRGLLQQCEARKKSRLVQGLMHLSFYLMIAALVILGAEVAYALYQLVNLTL